MAQKGFGVLMSGNSFGRYFVVTTFGESHGLAIGGIVDGCPPGMALTKADIQADLNRRRPGSSRMTTQRRESDAVQILSGVFEGVTTGTPIGLSIQNEDQRTRDYSQIKDLYRPGHADLTYDAKYGLRDYRGGGRASARETAVRVAAGAIARKYLKEFGGIEIQAAMTQMGPIQAKQRDWSAVEHNPFFFPDSSRVAELEALIEELRRAGDSVGARILVRAQGVPAGWGEPVFDKLDGDIAKALMSINAVKAVEIGEGFEVVTRRGSEHRDEISPEGFLSNRSGGILGGISSGQEIYASIALKPTSSIRISGRTIAADGSEAEISTKGRHDPCVGIRAVPVAEAMLSLVLMDHLLRQRAQNPDRAQINFFAKKQSATPDTSS